jgi:hypothetical protein
MTAPAQQTANVPETDFGDMPPLPEFAAAFTPRWPGDEGGFNAIQMHAYAIAAVMAERERIALECESLKKRPHGWNSFSYTNAVNDCLSAIRQPAAPMERDNG